MRKRLLPLVVVAMIGGLLSVAPAARGETFTVTTLGDTAPDGTCDAHCTLREAVIAANATPAVADTINVPNGVVSLTIPGGDDQTGEFDDLDISSVITILGAGITATTIDQTVANERVFDVRGGTGHLILIDLAVTGGSAPAFTFGGGVRVDDAGARMNALRVRFADNVGSGGAIGNSGTVTLEESLLENNGGNVPSTLSGGAITNIGTMTITRSAINNNDAANSAGAIKNHQGTLTIAESVISGNDSLGGTGGIDSENATLNLVDSTISGNTAAFGPGGVHVNGPTASIQMSGSTVSGNTVTATNPGQDGGGIRISSPLPNSIVNSTISGNSTTGGGGGLFAAIQAAGSLSLVHVTITNNTSDSDNDATDTFDRGGGLRTLPSGPVSIAGSIIVGNTDLGSQPTPNATNDCSSGSGLNTSLGFNVFGEPGPGNDEECAGIAAHPDDIVEASNTGWLLPLADNGGPTQTHAITSASPAFDLQPTGRPGCPGNDQRGFSRPVGAGCDAGSFELGAGPLPDAEIRLAGAPTFVGNDVYNTTGVNQTASTKKKRGRTARFEIRISNDGNGADTVAVTLCPAKKGFKVTFIGPGDAVLTGTPSFALAAGGSVGIEVAVKLKRNAKGRFDCLVTATSQTDGNLVDAVLATVKAKR